MASVEAGTAEQKLAAAHKALLETRGLQFDFAGAKVDAPARLPQWLLDFFEASGPVLVPVFWGGVIAGGLLILYFILRETVPESWLRGKRTVTATTDWRPEPEKARALLDDADTLAAAGRFEEAIHMLLYRSIDDLVARRPGHVRPALTSRDLAALSVLPPSAREAFARLAQAVERTFFGGRAAGADEFGAARADYEAFAFAEGWR
ncbi:MAG: DUF4129 domain-containing protein [Phenylobacterium sp.]|uniref:DUF4129 domain-containing protein n=1 Tax=Phenylobacterium sp. TaxID=1871053 RepID=UPI001A5AEB26|nr:DUF4129 domain-containing protein [Phenylobacterium sp.]MBL8553660.1 DUF4129 domain-containing protein [Phenylobacterium sp.]